VAAGFSLRFRLESKLGRRRRGDKGEALTLGRVLIVLEERDD
jgi:hypothetical protein